VGNEEISFDFRGGTLREFTEALNRRGRDMIQASLIAVRPGTNSLLIESRVTGAENRLNFAASAITLGQEIGMIEPVNYSDPDNPSMIRPLNAVSTAQDAIISMEGIQISRSGNEINDLLPGVTITLLETSDRPVRLQVVPDRESVKDSIIAFVGNYNRLMAEINILTRNDPGVIDEITYFTREEREDARERLGAFSGDSTLFQLRNSLMRIVSSPFPTSEEQNLALLAQIGISTDVRRAGSSGGADPSRLRGYLDIDERVLDAAIATRLPAVRQLFGNDTDGDLLVDTGIAFAVDALTRPYTDRSGILAQKTNGMDSRIAQERQRITTLDRQLANREMELRRQFNQMESAYNRMEQMSSSLDRFQQQNSNNFR
jgi:flagellar hook-associated protein 2